MRLIDLLRRWLLLTGTLSLLVVSAAPAKAITASDTASASGIYQYFVMAYNIQECDNATKYKIWSVEYRWKRNYTSRYVESADLNIGAHGTDCSRTLRHMSRNPDPFTPCWGCGNSSSTYYTHSYYSYLGWPYVGGPPYSWGLPWVGGNLYSSAYWHESYLGRLCSEIILAGETEGCGGF